MRFHLPPSSFIGYLRRCESWVMPCSRTDAPLAQCAPRLIGESNTGSCRTHTPFCTTASMAQPTEQCVQIVRFTSVLPLAASLCACASPIMLNGSCAATAPAPTPMPERLRKVRRSIVFATAPVAARARRACGAAWMLALRVRSMRISSDLGGAVVVVHVLGRLITLRRTFVFGLFQRCAVGSLRHDGRCGGGGAADTNCQQEISAGKFGFLLGHRNLLYTAVHAQNQGEGNPQNSLIQERYRYVLRTVLWNRRGVENNYQLRFIRPSQTRPSRSQKTRARSEPPVGTNARCSRRLR